MGASNDGVVFPANFRTMHVASAGETKQRRAASDPQVDAWLRIVIGGTDLSGIELRYTLPVAVEPWVAEFARIVSEELRNAGRVRR